MGHSPSFGTRTGSSGSRSDDPAWLNRRHQLLRQPRRRVRPALIDVRPPGPFPSLDNPPVDGQPPPEPHRPDRVLLPVVTVDNNGCPPGGAGNHEAQQGIDPHHQHLFTVRPAPGEPMPIRVDLVRAFSNSTVEPTGPPVPTAAYTLGVDVGVPTGTTLTPTTGLPAADDTTTFTITHPVTEETADLAVSKWSARS